MKSCSVIKPPQKKRKKTTVSEASESLSSVPLQDDFRKLKGRKGQLKIVTEFPLDILMEIFGHLHPLDLLSLSKTTKDLYEILMEKNSLHLWREAYASLIDLTNKKRTNIPECPPSVNILHYTNIIFGQYCDLCPARKACNAHYGVLVRMPQHVVEWAERGCGGEGTIDYRSNILLNQFVRNSAFTTTPVLESNFQATIIWRNNMLFISRHYQNATERKQEIFMFKLINKPHIAAGGMGHAAKRDDARALEQIQHQRHQAIKNKLIEEGYGPELDASRFWVPFLPGAKPCAPLIDRAWNRIKAKILRLYEWQRQGSRKYKLIHAFTQRMKHLQPLVDNSESGLSELWICAPVPYVAQSEPFAQIIKQLNENLTLDDAEEQSIMAQLDAQAHLICGITSKWRTEADNFLLGLLSQTADAGKRVGGQDADTTPLNLATMFFNCECKCKESIPYPCILVRRCLRNARVCDRDDDDAPNNDETPDDNEDAEDQEADVNTTSATQSGRLEVHSIPMETLEGVWDKMSSWWSIPWNQDAISIDEGAVGFSKTIIRACGEDPDTVTSAAMDARGLRVECMRCGKLQSKSRPRRVMLWRVAILHNIESHYKELPLEPDWRLVTDETDLVRIAAEENKIPQKWAISISKVYCIHCDCRVYTNNDLIRHHLSQDHNIKDDDTNLWQHLYGSGCLDGHIPLCCQDL